MVDEAVPHLTGPLAGTYSGTQCTLGMLFRRVSQQALSASSSRGENHSHSVALSDSLALTMRACLYLENALDHETDILRTLIIQREMDICLEFANRLESQLTEVQSHEVCHPLRWVYAYLLTLLNRTDDVIANEAALLLADVLQSELLEMEPTIESSEVDLIREHQQTLFCDIQSELRLRLQ